MPVIEFRDAVVDVDSPDGSTTPRRILGPITTTLTEHRIGIIGSNGSGKSTLARLINGLTDATGGAVLVDGDNVARSGREVRRKVGFVFSDADSQIVMPTVRDDVAFSLRKFKLSADERDHRVDAALARFGLSDHAADSPHTLSGGQKQLLALAAVIVMEPQLVIADEPTTLLDLRNRRNIAQIFSQLEQQMIVLTHDLDLLPSFDRVLCISDGTILADGSPQETIAQYVASVEDMSE